MNTLTPEGALQLENNTAKQPQFRTTPEHLSLESVDARLIGLMRLVLALSALIIIYIDPAEPNRYVVVTYGALILYSLYSAVLYSTSIHGISILPSISPHWVDVGWYLILVALSSGTSSVFFFFFFFAILVASFRWGFKQGLLVTIVSGFLFTLIGFFSAPSGPNFELNRFLLRPTYLLVLGYMMAYWGGQEIALKRRLALLKEVNQLSNPRFGVAQTISSIMGRLRAFYDADTCLFLTGNEGTGSYSLRRADRHHDERAVIIQEITVEEARLLLKLPTPFAIALNCKQSWWRFFNAGYQAFDAARGQRTLEGRAESEQLANLLETNALVTVPLRRRDQAIGRLYLTSTRHRFNFSDIDFVFQLVEHITPVIENIELLDQLASEAAERERARISRDIHDSTIQPYIGLKLGLETLRRKAGAGNALTGDIDDLIDMAGEGVADLRHYIGGLKGEARPRESMLLPAVRRQAERFTEFYGIKIEVNAATDICVNDRLAAEAFQIVREGLSNIRRHTSAQNAVINFVCSDGQLVLQIENDGAATSAATSDKRVPFVPRSITGRAEALGGTAIVEQRTDGYTTVTVRIPL